MKVYEACKIHILDIQGLFSKEYGAFKHNAIVETELWKGMKSRVSISRSNFLPRGIGE